MDFSSVFTQLAETLNAYDISSFASSIISNAGSVICLVMEIIILMKIGVPMYGLRAVPFYGDYFFYARIAPEKKKWSLIHVVISAVITLVALLYVGFIVALIITEDSSFSWESMLLSFIIICSFLFIAATVNIVIQMILNFSVAEKFAYNKYLGILFTFIPFLRDICCLVCVSAYPGDIENKESGYCAESEYRYSDVPYEDVYDVSDDGTDSYAISEDTNV